jgi:DNA integrity scanning protein DisA with diadenylate cyclase activity
LNLFAFALQIGAANSSIGFWDIVDFLVAAYLLFLIYRLLKGTLAFNIFIGVLLLYLLWWTVGAMDMFILSTILDQFVSVGVIVLVIIFQPEIRRFLLLVGSTTLKSRFSNIENFIKRGFKFETREQPWLSDLEASLNSLLEEKKNALIVITSNLNHESFLNSGVRLNAILSKELLESVAAKDSPMSSGAIIIQNGTVISAGCILPSRPKGKDKNTVQERSALGISEQSNSFAIVVNATKGEFKSAVAGELTKPVEIGQLMTNLKAHLTSTFDA